MQRLKNRGVKDILIACMDGLKGLPDAIKSVFPEVNIQSCIIHQIRNSIKYVSYKNKKEVVKDLKLIYTTNALEGFNRQIRKFTKTKTVFPTDDSLRKSLYLATDCVMKKWTVPIPNWGITLAQLTIKFKERIENI